MHYLAAYYNMSTFYYKTLLSPDGREYLLEVNPHYINREQTDRLNIIDARWIDMDSGMFIDITTARYNLTHPAGKGMLSCKDGHEFRVRYFLSTCLLRFRLIRILGHVPISASKYVVRGRPCHDSLQVHRYA